MAKRVAASGFNLLVIDTENQVRRWGAFTMSWVNQSSLHVNCWKPLLINRHSQASEVYFPEREP